MFSRKIIFAVLFAAGVALSAQSTYAQLEVTPVAIADVSSEFNADLGAIHTIDGSGLSGAGPLVGQTHNDGFPDGGGAGLFWHSLAIGGNPDDEFITFDLGQEFDLLSALIWNFNAEFTGGSEKNRGFNQYDMFVAGDGADPTNLGDFTQIITDGTLAQAGVAAEEPVQIVDITGSNGVRYVRIGADTNHGGVVTGLSEVRFLAVPEPASLALLGLGGVLMLKRRRHA